MLHKAIHRFSALAAVALVTPAVAAGSDSSSTPTPGTNARVVVGDGVSAVVTPGDGAMPSKAGWTAVLTPAGLLQLIDHTGGRLTITTVPEADRHRLVDASADGRRFLFSDFMGPVSTYDAQTRKWTRFDIGATGQVRLTRPTGAAILALAYDPDNNETSLRRYGLDGSFQTFLEYPDVLDGPDAVLPAMDGTTYLTPGRTSGLEVHNNATGALIRTIALPGDLICAPQRWWAPGVVMAGCAKGGDYLAMNAYKITLSTGRAVKLTKVRVNQPGIDWAWPTPSGRIVGRQIVLCGAPQFGILKNGVIPTPVSFGKKVPNLIGVTGNTMVMSVDDGCGGPTSTTLATQNVATGARAHLGIIDSAVVIDPRS